MSKMDNQRAMREAKFARDQARARGTSAAKRAAPPVAPAPAVTAKETAAASESAQPESAQADGPVEALCGHRSINGRTCTREAGHASKAHRYAAPTR